MVDAETGRPYRDDRGGSAGNGRHFLRMYQTDEPLCRLHCPPGLQPGSAGPSIVNDGGASTLVRQERRRPQLLRGKKVVLWEFVSATSLRDGGWQMVPLPRSPRRSTDPLVSLSRGFPVILDLHSLPPRSSMMRHDPRRRVCDPSQTFTSGMRSWAMALTRSCTMKV